MATNGSYVCRSGYGKASYFVTLPEANDALVVAVVQAGHEDDSTFGDRATFAALFAVSANKRCTAANYADLKITAGATETYDDTNNRLDSALATVTFPTLGALSGTNAKQEQAAVVLGYQKNQTGANDASTLLIAKFYYPFVADGRNTPVPLDQGFLRAVRG